MKIQSVFPYSTGLESRLQEFFDVGRLGTDPEGDQQRAKRRLDEIMQ